MQYRTARATLKEPPAKRLPYDGYRSFQYLRPGVDYREFELAAEINRVPSMRLDVSPVDEQRVQRLLSENVVISLHDHVTVAPVDLAEMTAYRSGGREWTGYEGLSISGLDAVFDALMGGTATITSRAGWKWDDIVYDLGMRLCDIAHQDLLVVAASRAAILAAKRAGQIAFIPCIESAAPIENELDRLDILYGLGIRSIGIAYSEANTLGAGLREEHDAGLTSFGRQAVDRMDRLGIAIDLSHAGDRTSLEAIQSSRNPLFITHAGARALWPTKRMKPDDVLRALAERGGVVGISAAANTTLTTKRPRHTLESVMEHFEYVARLIGIDHVAFGPDTFFGDHVGMHGFFSKHFSVAASRGPAFEEVEYVDGIENPAEAFPNVVRWLVKHEYSDTDIGKVMGGNVMRALEAVWVR
jgi:membrane dipeptidase